MPGVLIVEAMAQLGGLLMSQKLEHTGKIAVLLSLDKVKLRQPVKPGDQLILEAAKLLVDRVVEIEGDRRAIGIKNVTINEPFFEGHYPGTPIMPGVLIVEAMAQLGGLLMSQKLEHTGKIAVLLSLDKVKLRQPVRPGDQLILEAEAVRAKSRSGTVKCRAYVGTKTVAEALVKFMMVDAEQRTRDPSEVK